MEKFYLTFDIGATRILGLVICRAAGFFSLNLVFLGNENIKLVGRKTTEPVTPES